MTSVACLGSKLDSFSLNSCSLTFPIFSLRLRESSQILNKTETGFAVQDVSFHIQSVSVSKVLGPRPLTKAALREGFFCFFSLLSVSYSIVGMLLIF